MKIVVYGPERRTGALHDGHVVDLCGAFGKYACERLDEPRPVSLAETLVPSDLARFIEGGPRALDNARKAIEYLFNQALNHRDRRVTEQSYIRNTSVRAAQKYAAIIRKRRPNSG